MTGSPDALDCGLARDAAFLQGKAARIHLRCSTPSGEPLDRFRAALRACQLRKNSAIARSPIPPFANEPAKDGAPENQPSDKLLETTRRGSAAPIEAYINRFFSLAALSPLKLLVKFAGRTGNVNAARRTALPILHPFHNPGRLRTFRAVCALGGVHFLLAVSGFGYLGHRVFQSP